MPLVPERTVDGAQERVELGAVPGQLQRVAGIGHVDDAAAEDVDQALEFLAVGADRARLDQHHLALDVRPLGQVLELDHVDQLVQLLGDLLDDRVVAARDQGHARQARILGRRDRQRLDVVAARREQPGDPRQRTGLVFQQDGDDVPHRRCLLP
jgi:hypothetical protein